VKWTELKIMIMHLLAEANNQEKAKTLACNSWRWKYCVSCGNIWQLYWF